MISCVQIPENAAQARAIQQSLRERLVLKTNLPAVRTIAGIDVGYDPRRNESRASIVIVNARTLEPIHRVRAHLPTTFPYISGLLAFREIPVIVEALAQLTEQPDLLMVDGHGIAHPRRMGIAAHLGVLIDMPTIGVAKSRLCGSYTEPGTDKGEQTVLMDKEERIGTVLRSRTNVKPLFISPGHHIDHDTAVHWVWHTLTRYRLPEPTRLADKWSKYVSDPVI